MAVMRVPSIQQSFNLLTTYQVPQLPKLKLGLGVQWQDQTYLDVPEATTNGVITQKLESLNRMPMRL